MPFSIIDDVFPVSDEHPVITLGHDARDPDPENGFIIVEYPGVIYYYKLNVAPETKGSKINFISKKYQDQDSFFKDMQGKDCYLQSISTINMEEEKRKNILQTIETAGAFAVQHPDEYYCLRPPSWSEWFFRRSPTQDDINKRTAFEWARGKLIDCLGNTWINKIFSSSAHFKRAAIHKPHGPSSFSALLHGLPPEHKETKGELNTTTGKKTYALVDVDETLILNVALDLDKMKDGIPDHYLNMNLINALLQSKITDLYLFTAMRQGEQGLQERQALIVALKKKGFNVHGMITPADYVFPYLQEEELKGAGQCSSQTERNKFIDKLATKVSKEMETTEAPFTAGDKKQPVDVAYQSIVSHLEEVPSSSNSSDDAKKHLLYSEIGPLPIGNTIDKGKIYLQVTEDSLIYKAFDLEGGLKEGVIFKNNLPPGFPKALSDLIQSKETWLPVLSKKILRNQTLLQHEEKCNLAISVINNFEAAHDKLQGGLRFNHKGLLYKRFKQYLPPDLGRCLVFDDRQDVLDSVLNIEEKQSPHVLLAVVKVNVRADKGPVDSVDTYLEAIHPDKEIVKDIKEVKKAIQGYQRSVQGLTWFVPHVNRKREKLKALKLIYTEMTTPPYKTPSECFYAVYKKNYANNDVLWREIIKGTQTKALIKQLMAWEKISSVLQASKTVTLEK